MLRNAIVINGKVTDLQELNVIDYLESKLVGLNENDKKNYELLSQKSLIVDRKNNILNFFVGYLGYTVIDHGLVFYMENDKNIDKLKYVRDGYQLIKKPQYILENGSLQRYKDPIKLEIEDRGVKEAMNPENDLSFWYPRISHVGFRTPKTMIIEFTDKEIQLVKNGKWNQIKEDTLLERIYSHHGLINLNSEMFMRLGDFSNKFNFETCHLKNIDELYNKLMSFFDETYYKLEWLQQINLVLRSFIKVNYERPTIYNGMPLNTEMRAFYDFDKQELLGIYNYWETDTMLSNLSNLSELHTFADTALDIEKDNIMLMPYLTKEVNKKMKGVPLTGRWSIDFMYDGEDFVLIDMAHAECSYYYDKVLRKEKKQLLN